MAPADRLSGAVAEIELGGKLLAWWDVSRRELPWRALAGRAPDPYAVWLSEIMLQQTTVASVTGYFGKFMSRWPNVEALARAPLEDVLAAWAGLGYYARARNLHACAGEVVRRHGGRFPQEPEALLGLPGVGPYTAAAIAAIAFNRPCVAQDGNVERVVSRLFAVEEPLPAAKGRIKAHTESFLSRQRPGDFAQALMDLGATVCTPRSPDCSRCPLAGNCRARADGAQTRFPVKGEKPARPHRRGAAFVLLRGGEALLRRRPAKGLLGGMSEFPSTPLSADFGLAEAMGYAPAEIRWRRLEGHVRHVFTHFSLELAVFLSREAPDRNFDACDGYRWADVARLREEGLSSLMRKVAVHAELAGK
ncbi:A/G-specific adenine glycosylase [Methylocystis heyeri]|uniref:Adenine DNA glycosylase n=1 Tax=Methylocystis heyeri TaxID=391905 RepID=A0A6B8KHE8_9HYPH|nr:A/G-specific adenine glycosylase [Methylocystis heyeri]QGM46431.1 A/G-specific adenine glycosylase [Methylocystis heyeri]